MSLIVKQIEEITNLLNDLWNDTIYDHILTEEQRSNKNEINSF